MSSLFSQSNLNLNLSSCLRLFLLLLRAHVLKFDRLELHQPVALPNVLSFRPRLRSSSPFTRPSRTPAASASSFPSLPASSSRRSKPRLRDLLAHESSLLRVLALSSSSRTKAALGVRAWYCVRRGSAEGETTITITITVGMG